LAKSVKGNNDFPPNIEKNISLMYQNLWWPSKTATVFEKNPTRNDSVREDEQIKNKEGKTQMTK
jgi:hypothetical protein